MSAVAQRWAEDDLRRLESQGLRRKLEALSSPQGARVQVGGEWLVSFSSNDYLGLCGDPRLAQAMERGLREWGVGSGASRLVVGDSGAHRALESALADAMGTEAAVLFNSGYAANVGIVSTLCGPGDVVFSDALNHASIIDGCRLSRAKVVVYPHGDVAALAGLLAQHPGRRRLVCTDAVFSMDGDLAPLRELADLCEAAGAALFVDEAHAFGVLGPTGAGLCEALGLAHRVDVRMATLGKAAGAFGAFAATSRAVSELLVNRARSFVFSTSLPPALCVAAQEGVHLATGKTPLRERLWRNIGRFAAGLSALGVDAQARSAIFPVVLGTPERAMAAAGRLREAGLLVKPIRPPTVPEGTSRLRFALSAAHTDEHIDRALAALSSLEISNVRV